MNTRVLRRTQPPAGLRRGCPRGSPRGVPREGPEVPNGAKMTPNGEFSLITLEPI